MGALHVHSLDLTDAASAYRVGVVGKPGTTVAENGDPRMIEKAAAPSPPTFPRDPVGRGFEVVLERLRYLGGMFGGPSGPSPFSMRLRAERGPQPKPPSPTVTNVKAPTGTVAQRPTYETALAGYGSLDSFGY